MCRNHYEIDKQIDDFFALNCKELFYTDKDTQFRFSVHIGLNVAVRELAKEIDINQRAGYAICYASLYGHNNVVKTLLAKGADIHVSNDCPIRWAAEHGHLEVVKTLIEAGAYKTVEAILIAETNGYTEIIELLEG